MRFWSCELPKESNKRERVHNMKNVTLYDDTSGLGSEYDIVRVSNEKARFLVSNGYGCYIDKQARKKDIFRYEKRTKTRKVVLYIVD